FGGSVLSSIDGVCQTFVLPMRALLYTPHPHDPLLLVRTCLSTARCVSPLTVEKHACVLTLEIRQSQQARHPFASPEHMPMSNPLSRFSLWGRHKDRLTGARSQDHK